MEIRFIDLFAGIGGFRLGLERANDSAKAGIQQRVGQRCGGNSTTKQSFMGEEQFTCIWSCDIDKYCEQVYKKNFGHGFDAYDITTVDVSRIPDHDFLCSGFPCQSFSIAGKRRGFDDTRGALFFEICRVLQAKRPRLLLLENVKGLLSSDEGRTFHTILKSLDELGYDCQWEVLNSKNFGVPQNRERVFIIGHLRGTPRPQVFPLGEDGGLAVETHGGEGQELAASLRSHQSGGYGDAEMTLIACNQAYAVGAGFCDDRICFPDGLAPSLLSCANTEGKHQAGISHKNPIIAGLRLRRLTPLECERLQGFPDGWTEGVSDTQRYKMLGNAVTVNVIEAIGERLLMELGV